MRITNYFSVAAMMAMLAANTSCTKEDTIAPEENKNIVTLNVSTETLSRIGLTEDADGVKVAWEQDDVLEVWARPDVGTGTNFVNVSSTISKFTLLSGEGAKNATFSGTLPEGVAPEYLNVAYRKNTNNNALKEKPSDLSFQISAYPQLLTTELNEAPLVLGGLFQKQNDGTYSPVGKKMYYGGALFKITITGLTGSQNIQKMIFKNVNTSKWLGASPNFKLETNGTFGSNGAGGINGSIELIPTSNSSVATDASGNVTVYSFIAPHTKNAISTDYDVYIKYVGDATEYKVGVIDFADPDAGGTVTTKRIEYGKCYTVTLDASTAN